MSGMRMPGVNPMFQAGGGGYFVPTMPQPAQRFYPPAQMAHQMRPGPRWQQPAAGMRLGQPQPGMPAPFRGGAAQRQAAPVGLMRGLPAQQARPITGQQGLMQPAAGMQPRPMMAAQNPAAAGQPRPGYKYTPNMRNPPQGMPAGGAMMAQQGALMAQQPQSLAQSAVRVQGQEPLTASMLAAAPEQEQKQMLGERLYPMIQRMYPELAGKVTGMLLEIDNSELVHMLEHNESLKGKVDEAVAVLQAHQGKAPPAAVAAGDAAAAAQAVKKE